MRLSYAGGAGLDTLFKRHSKKFAAWSFCMVHRAADRNNVENNVEKGNPRFNLFVEGYKNHHKRLHSDSFIRVFGYYSPTRAFSCRFISILAVLRSNSVDCKSLLVKLILPADCPSPVSPPGSGVFSKFERPIITNFKNTKTALYIMWTTSKRELLFFVLKFELQFQINLKPR